MRNGNPVVVFACFLILFVAQGIFAVNSKPIGLYDLTYTLKIDYQNQEQLKKTWDHYHAISTLQGIVNRHCANLYVLYVQSQIFDGVNIDQYWLDKYRQPGSWLSNRRVQSYRNIEQLIQAYRSYIKGVVVYDSKVPATSNIASTVAGIEDLIAVRYDTSKDSLYSLITAGKTALPVKVWLVNPDGTSQGTDRPCVQKHYRAKAIKTS